MRTYYGTREIQTDAGETAVLSYYCLKERTNCCTGYGAEIVMRRASRMETASARHVTTSSDWIRALLELLYSTGTTPNTLRDVVEAKLGK